MFYCSAYFSVFFFFFPTLSIAYTYAYRPTRTHFGIHVHKTSFMALLFFSVFFFSLPTLGIDFLSLHVRILLYTYTLK